MIKHHRLSIALGVVTIVLFLKLGVYAVVLDLTTEGSSGTINNVLFQQFDPDTATGTGVIDSFVRIQASGVEQGYNTDGRPLEFDEGHAWTKSLLLSDVPTITIDGTGYRQFLLDINQDGQVLFSLDKLQIALQSSGSLLGYSSIFSNPIYDLDDGGDNWIKLDYSLNAGSGSGDMIACIPDSLFTGSNQYVYLYSMFGDNLAADNGFEEWSVGANGPIVPEPATIILFGLAGILSLRRRK